MERPNNNNSHYDHKRSSAKNEKKKITIIINQNNTLQDNKEYNKLTKQEEQWIRIKKEINKLHMN